MVWLNIIVVKCYLVYCYICISCTEEINEICASPTLIRRQCDESVAIEQHYFVALFSFNWIICAGIEV